jgi:hypothetical protein
VEVDRTLSLLLRRDWLAFSGGELCQTFKSVCDARVKIRIRGAGILLETGLDGSDVSNGNSGPGFVSERSDWDGAVAGLGGFRGLECL